MPRRNLFWLLAFTLLSFMCAVKISPYGRVILFAMDQIDQRALEQVDERSLFEGALEGMVKRLDDFSDYISPEMVRQFEETINQRFIGIGVEILRDPASKQLTVASPLVGAPAERAGIRAGDVILRIDDKSTQGLSPDDATSRIRGEPNTKVKLTVLHQGENAPVDVEIVRQEIRVDTVLGDTRNPDGSWNFMLEGHDRIGYLRIHSFSENTEEEVHKALDELVKRQLRGLILDLRNNPGGLLVSAIGISDLFVEPDQRYPDGRIVSTVDRAGTERRVYYAKREGTYRGFPIVVLVNQLSASASEILAACLQDHGRALVVGQRSYGKGTVQELLELPPGEGVLKLTTAGYRRPNRQDLHRRKGAKETDRWGVDPDPGCEVKVEGDELTRLREWRARRDHALLNGKGASEEKDDAHYVDPQLAKAIECLEQTAGPRPQTRRSP